jgi:hypothetical protein
MHASNPVRIRQDMNGRDRPKAETRPVLRQAKIVSRTLHKAYWEIQTLYEKAGYRRLLHAAQTF